MIRKLLVAGAMVVLAMAPSVAPARAQQFAPVPTSPESTTTTTSNVLQITTTTASVSATTVAQPTDDFANTGPRDWIGFLTLAGVVSFALGVGLRGKRAAGAFYFDRK